MATRGQPVSDNDIHEPELPGIPSNEPDQVDPQVADKSTEGVTTMAGLFGKAVVVDEVVEQPMMYASRDEVPEWWVIRPGENIEDMTVGQPHNHYAFKAGTRYRVSFDVAQILYNRDKLIEVPYPYEEQRRR